MVLMMGIMPFRFLRKIKAKVIQVVIPATTGQILFISLLG